MQPVDPAVDYFRIFGLDRGYNIKDNSLEGKYKDWQKKLHPDLVHTKSEKERAFAAEQSALVIDAYRTLSKPLPRALYLLQLEDILVDEEKTINDPELLMEMMEIREAVSEASDSQTLEKIQSQMKMKLETWSKSFQEAFDKRDFDRAVEATQRMRYYERAMEETVKKLQSKFNRSHCALYVYLAKKNHWSRSLGRKHAFLLELDDLSLVQPRARAEGTSNKQG